MCKPNYKEGNELAQLTALADALYEKANAAKTPCEGAFHAREALRLEMIILQKNNIDKQIDNSIKTIKC